GRLPPAGSGLPPRRGTAGAEHAGQRGGQWIRDGRRAMSVLEVRDLTVEFRQRGGAPLRAVDRLSFSLEPGKTLALVGESGSGKSTVVRAVGQLVRPTPGTILLEGQPAGRRGRALRAYRHQVQLVFQDPFASLNPVHTIRHHLTRPLLLLHPEHGRARVEEEVDGLLRSVNLTPPGEVAARHPHELSGGQRQRVAIARALAARPTGPPGHQPGALGSCWRRSRCPCSTSQSGWRS